MTEFLSSTKVEFGKAVSSAYNSKFCGKFKNNLSVNEYF